MSLEPQNREIKSSTNASQPKGHEISAYHAHKDLARIKLENKRNEIVRLRKTINARNAYINQKNQIIKMNKVREENATRVHEVITVSSANILVSLRLIYHSLQHSFGDESAMDKAGGEVENCLQIAKNFGKQLEDMISLPSQVNSEKVEGDVDTSVDSEEEALVDVGIESMVAQYHQTESIIGELSTDLERKER
ncbi:12551_t:CDS:2 [Acaulospora colombiana]|uniref:12551_t:CDS:1 n=1 Tax=Acaulospora colombiana TaxID=27376 RepID=A0ACA9JXB1_9GLOM|nr:12551_t:CDS:2 [Acaulospora colombiana]